MWFAILATVIIGALLYKLFLSRGPSDFWEKHGIPEVDLSPAMGKLDVILGRKAVSAGDDYAYNQMGSTIATGYCGFMDSGKPLILLKDTELIKKVMIKDFDHFIDRRQFFTDAERSFKKIMFNLEGEEWKAVRNSLSPIFTTGKIRRMMEHFNSVAKEWVEEYSRKASSSSGSIVIDVQDSVNQYTVEVISTTAFGIVSGVIKNPEGKFNKMVKLASDVTAWKLVKFTVRIMFPKFSKMLGYSIIDDEMLDFFEGILDQGLKSRMSGETKRNDFLQLMVEVKKGELKAAGADELDSFEKDAVVSATESQKKQYFTDEMMIAQSISFFFAGFSTTSNFLVFALYALALHPEIQDKLREEVNKIVKEDASLDYDDVGQLVYLDMVSCEVLRKFSALERLERLCVKDYKDAETGLVIPKGTLIGIPLHAIHNDKQYYENPDKFDPEHFTPEKKAARSQYAYMPFGVGPRNCIGMRFAQIEVKSALAHMVHNFVIEPTPKTPVPLQTMPTGLHMLPPKKLELKLTPIKK